MKRFIPAVLSFIVLLIPEHNLFAQSSKQTATVLCRSTKTGLVVGRTKCKSGESRVNPPEARFAGCYWRLGSAVTLAGLPQGQVTLSESCNANDVVVNHSVSHNEKNPGIVAISSEAFTSPTNATHSLPQGVSVRLDIVSTSGIQPPIPAGEAISAELHLLCCPYQ